MPGLKNEPKKAYLQLAGVIETMQIKSMLTRDEKVSLQNLLDLTDSAEHSEFFEALELYLNMPRTATTQEIDDIVKATLIGTDLSSTNTIENLIQMLIDLTGEKVRLLDQE